MYRGDNNRTRNDKLYILMKNISKIAVVFTTCLFTLFMQHVHAQTQKEKIKLLNLQLMENNKHLKAVNEELDRFAYVASHDLQEPLRKIMVFSDKIISGKNDPPIVEKYLNKITSSSQRMQLLINNLLQFSRESVNEADFVNVDLKELVKEALVELEVEIEKTGAQIIVGSLPKIFAVPGLMRQLFFNLINNAIKFKRIDQPPVVNIFSERITSSDSTMGTKFIDGINYYKISVSDNGIGFDEKYAKDIFLVFKRLHSYHEFEGTGVGLSICKKIIEKHNGYLTAFGDLNQGATFVIELPEIQKKVLKK